MDVATRSMQDRGANAYSSAATLHTRSRSVRPRGAVPLLRRPARRLPNPPRRPAAPASKTLSDATGQRYRSYVDLSDMDPETRAFLEGPNFGHLATLMADGAPHSVALWVAV